MYERGLMEELDSMQVRTYVREQIIGKGREGGLMEELDSVQVRRNYLVSKRTKNNRHKIRPI